MKYLILAAMLVTGQAALAAAPMFGTASETKYARDLVPPKGKALVYIYQRKQDGSVVSPRIWLNNYELGRIVPGSFMVWQLAPGRLGLRVGGAQPASLSILSQAGRVYLFRLTVVQTEAGPKARLERLPESYRGDMVATQLIKNPRQVTPAIARQPARPPATTMAATKPAPKARPKARVALRPGGFSILLKTGSMSLSNQTQTVLGTDLSFDKSATGLYGVEVDYQLGNGLATGGELLGYKTHFTTVAGTGIGDVSVLVLLANIKQYYRTHTNLQPFIGAGIGVATTDVSGTLITGNTAGLAYQLLAGIEYRASSIGFLAEAKYVGADTKDSAGNGIDVTGTGLYAGIAFHF